mmetsp:Transcript_36305/g.116594  ORF Transcript_36305/g.116594 Transcript_36305/m.116594 type:complete len:207 (-) Transcript_36305:618-1238(-)
MSKPEMSAGDTPDIGAGDTAEKGKGDTPEIGAADTPEIAAERAAAAGRSGANVSPSLLRSKMSARARWTISRGREKRRPSVAKPSPVARVPPTTAAPRLSSVVAPDESAAASGPSTVAGRKNQPSTAEATTPVTAARGAASRADSVAGDALSSRKSRSRGSGSSEAREACLTEACRALCESARVAPSQPHRQRQSCSTSPAGNRTV